jgi:hypothetical protein
MILSNIIVVFFLQNSVQIGIVKGADFKGDARTEFKNSVESKGVMDAWIENALADKSKPLSFCIIEPEMPSEYALSDHLGKRLIAREENGQMDIMSTPENVARHRGQGTVNDINFSDVAGYCWMTITNLSTKTP